MSPYEIIRQMVVLIIVLLAMFFAMARYMNDSASAGDGGEAPMPPGPTIVFPDGAGGGRVKGSLAMGTPNATEDTTTTDLIRMVEDDQGNRVIHYAETTTLTDETAGSVDVVHRKWGIFDGIVGLIYSDAEYSEAPSGYETAIAGCRVRSDGTGSSPWDVAGWVYTADGNTWVAD